MVAFCLITATSGSAKPIVDYRITAILPLPKDKESRSVGAESKCVIEATIDHFNRTTKKNVTVEFFDNERSTIGSSKAAHKIAESGFDMAFGTFSSSRALPAANVLNDKKIPFLTPTASSPKVTADKEYVYSLSASDDDLVASLSNFVVAQQPKVVALVQNLSKENSVSTANILKSKLTVNYPSATIHEFNVVEGHFDAKKLLPEILKSNPDLLLVPIHSFEAASLYNELKKINRKIKMIGGGNIGGRKDFFDLIG